MKIVNNYQVVISRRQILNKAKYDQKIAHHLKNCNQELENCQNNSVSPSSHLGPAVLDISQPVPHPMANIKAPQKTDASAADPATQHKEDGEARVSILQSDTVVAHFWTPV